MPAAPALSAPPIDWDEAKMMALELAERYHQVTVGHLHEMPAKRMPVVTLLFLKFLTEEVRFTDISLELRRRALQTALQTAETALTTYTNSIMMGPSGNMFDEESRHKAQSVARSWASPVSVVLRATEILDSHVALDNMHDLLSGASLKTFADRYLDLEKMLAASDAAHPNERPDSQVDWARLAAHSWTDTPPPAPAPVRPPRRRS